MNIYDEAKASYVAGRCTLEEFETVIDKLLHDDFPIEPRLVWRVLPETAERGFGWQDGFRVPVITPHHPRPPKSFESDVSYR